MFLFCFVFTNHRKSVTFRGKNNPYRPRQLCYCRVYSIKIYFCLRQSYDWMMSLIPHMLIKHQAITMTLILNINSRYQHCLIIPLCSFKIQLLFHSSISHFLLNYSELGFHRTTVYFFLLCTLKIQMVQR